MSVITIGGKDMTVVGMHYWIYRVVLWAKYFYLLPLPFFACVTNSAGLLNSSSTLIKRDSSLEDLICHILLQES